MADDYNYAVREVSTTLVYSKEVFVRLTEHFKMVNKLSLELIVLIDLL